jgi:hypothetical protein
MQRYGRLRLTFAQPRTVCGTDCFAQASPCDQHHMHTTETALSWYAELLHSTDERVHGVSCSHRHSELILALVDDPAFDLAVQIVQDIDAALSKTMHDVDGLVMEAVQPVRTSTPAARPQLSSGQTRTVTCCNACYVRNVHMLNPALIKWHADPELVRQGSCAMVSMRVHHKQSLILDTETPATQCEVCCGPLQVDVKEFKIGFACHHCGIVFHAAERLVAHSSRHTGIKMHTCGVCQRTFSRIDRLRQHVRKSHGAALGSE